MKQLIIAPIIIVTLAAASLILWQVNFNEQDDTWPLDWPPFVVTFEEGSEVKELHWNSPVDWKMVTIKGKDIARVVRRNTTGTIEQQSGWTYITYDAAFGNSRTEQLDQGKLMIPGEFGMFIWSLHGIALRSDYERVTTHAIVCINDSCTHNAPGLKFDSLVFTDDEYRIPLETSGMRVMELRITPQ